MGGSTKRVIKDIATGVAVVGATALGGPAAGAATFAGIRAGQGKDIIPGPKIPGAPEVPEIPGVDSAEQLIRQRALTDRLLRASRVGAGRRATTATSRRSLRAK
jgi:hypothetical protein